MLQLHVQAKDCLLKTIGEDAKRLVSDVITHGANNVYHCMYIVQLIDEDKLCQSLAPVSLFVFNIDVLYSYQNQINNALISSFLPSRDLALNHT